MRTASCAPDDLPPGGAADRLLPRRRPAEELRAERLNVTGDASRDDMDGYFHYQARTDDMIISAGYNIAGPEVRAHCSGIQRQPRRVIGSRTMNAA
jgi:hypothetical protein